MENVFLNDLLFKVMQVSSKDGGTLSDRVIKITEEVGEIASGYGTYSGYKSPKKPTSKVEALENVREECIDTIIVALDILTRDFDMDEHEFYAAFNEKCQAWEEVIRRKNETKLGN